MKRLLLLLLVVPMAAFAQLSNATRIQGRNVAPTAPTDTQCLAWNAGVSQWQPASTCGSGGGSGTVTSITMAGTSRQITVSGTSPCTTICSWTFSVPVGFLLVAANGTLPSLNIPDGTAPGTPATGDLWAESGVFKTPNAMQFGVGGTAAGYIGLTQGSAPSAGTTNITLYAPAAVTSYKRRFAGAAFTGVTLWTNTAGDMVETGLTTSGSGPVLCLTVSCVMTTPDIGVATATSVNGTSIPSSQTLATLAVTQTFSGDKAFTGLFNAGGASRSAPFRIGTIAGLPASCTVGDMYFASNATAGRNLYYCAVTDTWTLQVVGAGGTGCVPGGSAGQFIVDDGAGACTSLSILTRTTNTIAGSAALTFDLSASTAIKVPGALTTGVLHNTTSTGAVVGGLIVNADITNSTIDLTAKVTGALPAANMANAVRDTVIGVIFDGGGSALAAGTTVAKYITVPFACTIVGYNIAVDAGTATFKTWRKATGTAIPTVSDSISTSGVAISSGTALQSTTTSDWTSTAVSANDILGLNLSAVATATQATFEIVCRK